MLPVLSGLRVVAVEQYGAGPYGSMQLADLGAEVIKIENPADGGDMARHVGPFFFGDGDRTDDSQFFHSFNRNKKSVTLDLKKPGARRVQHAPRARFLEIEGDALLVAVEAVKELAVVGAVAVAEEERSDMAGHVAAIGRVLDLDHLGAEIGQLHRA